MTERQKGECETSMCRGTGKRLTTIGPDGNTLIGDIRGSDDGQSLILLHGGGQNRHSWRTAAQRFASAGYKVITFDLRGHGESDWSREGDYRIERFVADLLAIVELVGAPAVLIGASFGGHVSLVTAARHPLAVRALVLCDVTPWIEGEATEAIRAKMSVAARGYASLEEAAGHMDLIRGFSADHDLQKLGQHLRLDGDGRFYWRWDPLFFSRQEGQRVRLTEVLHASAENLQVPTLLIRADLSEFVTVEQVEKFSTLVPHVVSKTIQGTHHAVNTKNNNAYVSLILEFLSRSAL